jgi:dihydroorotate dehydrogenase (fumarate)
LGILRPQVQFSLAATGGFHTEVEVLKALLAGADVVHLCSALLQQGPAYLGEVLTRLHQWLEEHEYESIEQLKGSFSKAHAPDPAVYDRANYLDVLDSYTPSNGVRV